jgi:hypothetical protein
MTAIVRAHVVERKRKLTENEADISQLERSSRVKQAKFLRLEIQAREAEIEEEKLDQILVAKITELEEKRNLWATRRETLEKEKRDLVD